MKRLILTVTEEQLKSIDFNALMAVALDFRIENVEGMELPKKKTGSLKNRGGMTINQHIMSHYTPEGVFSHEAVKSWLKKLGYNDASASPAVSELKQEGYIERLIDGRFKFLKPLGPNS